MNSSSKGWVLYDGACGFCSKWVIYWEETLKKIGFEIAPLQEPWVQERLHMAPEKISEDLRLLLEDDTLISGADVYLYVMKKIWWSWPFSILFRLPGLYWIFCKCYKIFNRNRFFISKTCGLPGHFHKK